jgi:lysophospholipase L1-like esterase
LNIASKRETNWYLAGYLIMKILHAILIVSVFASCSKNDNPLERSFIEKKKSESTTTAARQQTYLALGDSYTIGESVSQAQSFPYLLVSKLNSRGKNFSPPKVIARTGWTTNDLQKAIVEAKITKKYDFVTLLIGVNNQYQGLSKSIYRTQFKDLLNQAINYADGKVSHVSVISIPDWGQTPFGKRSGRSLQKISEEIAAFNAINKAESSARGVSYTNITPASNSVSADPGLVAQDGLHYSGKMHAIWVDAIIATFNRDN